MSSGNRSRTTWTAQSGAISLSASSIALSILRPSRSSLISLIVSMSRLSYCTTTRPGMVALSSGAMSISGAAVISMPPVWIDRCRGKPSMRPVSSSQRSQGDSPTVDGLSAAAVSHTILQSGLNLVVGLQFEALGTPPRYPPERGFRLVRPSLVAHRRPHVVFECLLRIVGNIGASFGRARAGRIAQGGRNRRRWGAAAGRARDGFRHRPPARRAPPRAAASERTPACRPARPRRRTSRVASGPAA